MLHVRALDEEAITIECHGEHALGILHRGRAPSPDIGVLIIVGGPQYRVGSHRQFVITARELAASGYDVFRFDYRGMGDSSGSPVGFEHAQPDIEAAIRAFKAAAPRVQRIVVFGLCDAASAALMHCTQDENVVGMILANPWARTPGGQAQAYVRHYYGQRLLQLSFWKKLLSRDFNLRGSARDFLHQLRLGMNAGGTAGSDRGPDSYIEKMRKGLSRFDGQVLLIISENDLTASEFMDLAKGSKAWAVLLREPKLRHIQIAGADHTFSTEGTLDFALASIRSWLQLTFSASSSSQ
jgi:uncharacterized protein